MSDALAELRAQEEQRQRQAQAPAPVARPTLPPRTPIEPAIARQGKNQWPSIARALVAGEFPSLVRRNFNFNTRQWYHLMRNDEFQVILAEIEATVHAEVVVNIVHEEETLAAKLDRLRTGSLEVLEESLDDEDPKVRRETALSVARLTVGDKHQIDLNGRVGLTLDADTASAVQSALNDLKDLPVDRPARQPETPLLAGQS